MTVELITVSREDLERRRRELLQQIGDVDGLRRRANEHAAAPEERDLLIELQEVEFLLGDDG